ncbi:MULTISPECIES: hypothetical protein [Limnospira]|uniref:Uncharacterized protein n=1 Tax=Limnospira fusiformis PMC 851.14 TaxID=2219512 RepID=A0ABU9EQX5_LIMFS|nr:MULTISPECIES: hypothetical protein [Limnospira]
MSQCLNPDCIHSFSRLGEAQRNPTSPAVINQVSVKQRVNFRHLW